MDILEVAEVVEAAAAAADMIAVVAADSAVAIWELEDMHRAVSVHADSDSAADLQEVNAAVASRAAIWELVVTQVEAAVEAAAAIVKAVEAATRAAEVDTTKAVQGKVPTSE